MSDLGKVLTVSLTLYVLVAGVFLLLENRRPQATLAWLLAFVFIPGVGLLAYVLFGRSRNAFSRNPRFFVVMLSLRDDFENYCVIKPNGFHEKTPGQVLDQVIAWGGALRALRETHA
ncbi:MAG TPA: PLDc N-terminal domain-containing protein [Fimbriiglobus sp.]|nr:PLDc N-terminal domain-containing protein [Fimbriiglobus sp.]